MRSGAFSQVMQLVGYVTGMRLERKSLIPSGPELADVSCWGEMMPKQVFFFLWKQDTLGLVVKKTHPAVPVFHTHDRTPS